MQPSRCGGRCGSRARAGRVDHGLGARLQQVARLRAGADCTLRRIDPRGRAGAARHTTGGAVAARTPEWWWLAGFPSGRETDRGAHAGALVVMRTRAGGEVAPLDKRRASVSHERVVSPRLNRVSPLPQLRRSRRHRPPGSSRVGTQFAFEHERARFYQPHSVLQVRCCGRRDVRVSSSRKGGRTSCLVSPLACQSLTSSPVHHHCSRGALAGRRPHPAHR